MPNDKISQIELNGVEYDIKDAEVKQWAREENPPSIISTPGNANEIVVLSDVENKVSPSGVTLDDLYERIDDATVVTEVEDHEWTINIVNDDSTVDMTNYPTATHLQNVVNRIDSDIDAVDSKVDNVDDRLSGRIDDIENDIADLESADESINSSIGALSADVQSNSGKINELEGDIDTTNAALADHVVNGHHPVYLNQLTQSTNSQTITQADRDYWNDIENRIRGSEGFEKYWTIQQVKDYVNGRINQIPEFGICVLNMERYPNGIYDIPQGMISKSLIYLVPSTNPDQENVYTEYVYTDENGWECIGSQRISLENYYDKDEVNAMLATKQSALTAGENINIANGVIKSTTTVELYDADASLEAESDVCKYNAQELSDIRQTGNKIFTYLGDVVTSLNITSTSIVFVRAKDIGNNKVNFVRYTVDANKGITHETISSEVNVATSSTVGTVKPGYGLDVELDGTLNVDNPIYTSEPANPQEGDIWVDFNDDTSNGVSIGDIAGLTAALASKYEKPVSGIPASDLAAGAIPNNVVVLTNTNGVCNYSKSQIDTFISEGKILVYNGKMLVYNTSQTNYVMLWMYNGSALNVVQIGSDESDTAFVTTLSQTFANNNQSIDGTTQTINQWLSSLSSQKVNLTDVKHTPTENDKIITEQDIANIGGAEVKNGTDLVIKEDTTPKTVISDLDVGADVYINENGSPTAYKIVEKRTDAVVLLRKSSVGDKRFDDTRSSTYIGSEIDTWLNSTDGYLSRFSSNIISKLSEQDVYVHNDVTHTKRKSFIPSTKELDARHGTTYNDEVYDSSWSGIYSVFTTDVNSLTRTLASSNAYCRVYRTSYQGTSYLDGSRTQYLDGTSACFPAICVINEAEIDTTTITGSYLLSEADITYDGTVDKIQDGNKFYKIKDQDARDAIDGKQDALPSGQNVDDILMWNGTGWQSFPRERIAYTPLNYIQSTGSQFIKLSFVPTNKSRVKIHFKTTEALTNDKTPFGEKKDTSPAFQYNLCVWNNVWYFDFGTASVNLGSYDSSVEDYVIDINKNKITFNGVEHTITDTVFTASYPINIFNRNANGSPYTYSKTKMQLLSFEAWEDADDAKTLDLVPRRNIFTDEYGMLNQLDYHFYGNDGTGDFTGN